MGLHAILFGILALAAISDVRTRTIPNVVTFWGVGLAVTAALLQMLHLAWTDPQAGLGVAAPAVRCVAGLVACGVPMVALWCAGSTGGGDAKLAAVIGAFLGWRLGLSALLWCHLLAATGGIVAAIRAYGIRRVLLTGYFWFAGWFFPAGCGIVQPERDAVLQTRLPMGGYFAVGTLCALYGGSLL